MSITLRKGTDADAALIVGYLKKLAEYEKLGDVCNITPEALTKLMNEENGLSVTIAEQDGIPVGIMTYYFYKIATFSGKRVMYIEDIFIDEANDWEVYTQDGLPSAQWEIMVLVTETGHEVLCW